MSSSSLPLVGAFTALVTPFQPNGELDLDALDRLVERQIDGGISGLVPVGTTGEAPTLTDDEAATVIKRVVAAAKGRVPVLAGTGSFSTAKTIAASKRAFECGADGVMVVMPYYSKPSQEGMYGHMVQVARAVSGPIVLYNVPGRTVADLGVETTVRICEEAANVVGLKDATGNVLRCQELTRRLGDRLSILCGDDALTLPMMSVGATGVISVTSNVYPDDVGTVVRLARAGEHARARKLHFSLLPVHEAMFLEPSPACPKAALSAQKHMTDTVRSPMAPATEATRARVVAALAAFEETS